MPLAVFLEDTGPQCLFHSAPPASRECPHPLGAQNVAHDLLVPGMHEGHLTKQAFLAVWAYYTLVDAPRAVAALLYLGFPDTYGCAARRLSACCLWKCPATVLAARAPYKLLWKCVCNLCVCICT